MSQQPDDLYSLLWNNHLRNLKGAFEMFRTDTALVDVTLSCEGRQLKAHRIVLSACSAYFWELFRDNPCTHPIVILRDVQYRNMVDLLTFMYLGEVNVSTDHLNSFLRTAEFLQVKGLMEDRAEHRRDPLTREPSIEVDRAALEPKVITRTRPDHSGSDRSDDDMPIKEDADDDDKAAAMRPTGIADNDEGAVAAVAEADDGGGRRRRATRTDEPCLKSESDDIDVVDNTMFEFIGTNTSDTNLSVDGNEVPYFTNEIIDVFVRQAKEMKKSKYTKRKVSPRNKLFHCTVCDKKFLNRDSVYKHMQSHEGRTKCPICHKILSRRSHVLRHIASKHGHVDN